MASEGNKRSFDAATLAEPIQLKRVRVILVATSLARNIGSAARAMKTMGLSRLYLVNPEQFPHQDAISLASGADDLLRDAVVCHDLESALGDCTAVYGASARPRGIQMPELSARAAALQALNVAEAHEVAFVFGSERQGLENHELLMCQQRLEIPANPQFSSLNLASAVQIVCYELRQASLSPRQVEPVRQSAPIADLERFLEHLSRVCEQIGFFGNKNPEIVLTRLRRLYQRAQMNPKELQMLRGVLTETEHALERARKR